jgi:hypothetical protein
VLLPVVIDTVPLFAITVLADCIVTVPLTTAPDASPDARNIEPVVDPPPPGEEPPFIVIPPRGVVHQQLSPHYIVHL